MDLLAKPKLKVRIGNCIAPIVLAGMALTATAVVVLQVGVLRPFFAVLLTLLLPGYALIEVLFPSGQSINSLEKITLGLVLSLAISPMVAIALGLLSATSSTSLALALSALSTFFALLVVYRRHVLRDHAALDGHASITRFGWWQISSIITFVVIVRLLSFLVLDRNMMMSDPEPMIVHDIANGSIPASYASLWHYLGLAPYSYPILFHSLLAELQVLGGFSLSNLFLVNAYIATLPVLIVYVLVNRVYGRSAATLSAFILATAPIFIFETLLGTFKARGMAYAFIAATMYCFTGLLLGKRRGTFLVLGLLLLFASSLTYRAALPVNIFMVLSLLGAALVVKTGRMMRLVGGTFFVLGLVVMAAAYRSYTGSLADLATIPSSLAKEGPLLLAGILGVLAMDRRNRVWKILLSVVGLGSLTIGLMNWKAADVVPILLSPLAGLGLMKLAGLRIPLLKLNIRRIAAATVLTGLLTTSFAIAYYPSKWYMYQDPQTFDELAYVKDFVAAHLQKGAIALGSGYTVTALPGSRSGIVIIGEDQRAFVEAFALNMLVTYNFDPGLVWAWRTYAGLIYDNSGQFYDSILSLRGNALKQFVITYFVQYIVTENEPYTNKWLSANRPIFSEVLVTNHYKVLEVVPTRPQIRLLAYVNEKLPRGAILAPYYLSPFIGQLREDPMQKSLTNILNFNYPLAFERLRRDIPREQVSNLRSRVLAVEEAYSSALRLLAHASKTNTKYVIVDSYHKDIRERLLSRGQKLVFSEVGLALFEITASPTQPTAILTVEVIHSNGAPVQNTGVSVMAKDGRRVGEGYTDSSGLVTFALPIGAYVVTTNAADVPSANTVLLQDDLRVAFFIGPMTSRRLTIEARDSLDQKAIAGARVDILDLNGTLLWSRLTDEAGQASTFPTQRTYNVTLSYLGSSSSRVISLKSDTNLVLELKYFAIAVNAVSNRYLPIGPVRLIANGATIITANLGELNTIIIAAPRGSYTISVTSGDVTRSLAITIYYATFIPIIFY